MTHRDPPTPTDPGHVTVILGCMFSGKTTTLLRRVADAAPGTVLTVKHVIDRRYSLDKIVSHDGVSIAAVTVANPNEILKHLRRETRLLAVDEAHFFEPSLADLIRMLVDRGVSTVATLLDRDSWGQPLPLAGMLMEMGDEPIHLHASCGRCGKPADRTQRLTPIVHGNMVGGREDYEPRCATCWHPPPDESFTSIDTGR